MPDSTDPAPVAGTIDPAGRRCKLALILDNTTEHNRQLILTQLHDPDVPDWRLAQRLAHGGRRVSAASLSRHRSGACVCDPAGDTANTGAAA